MIKTYNFVAKQAGIKLIEFNVRESRKRFLATRVQLRDNIFRRLRLRFFRQKAESNNLSCLTSSELFSKSNNGLYCSMRLESTS